MNTLRLLLTLFGYFCALRYVAISALQYSWMKITGNQINLLIAGFIGFLLTSKILIWLMNKGFVIGKPNELRRSYDVVFKPKDKLGRSKFLWLRSGWNFIPFWHELHPEVIQIENFEPADFSGKILTLQGEVNLVSALLNCAIKDDSDESLNAYVASGKDETSRRKSIPGRLKNWVIQIISASLASEKAEKVVAQKDNFIAALIQSVTDKNGNLDDELGVRVLGTEIGNIVLPTTLNELRESEQRSEKLVGLIQKMKAELPQDAGANIILGAALAAIGDENAAAALIGGNGNYRGGGKIVGVHLPHQHDDSGT